MPTKQKIIDKMVKKYGYKKCDCGCDSWVKEKYKNTYRFRFLDDDSFTLEVFQGETWCPIMTSPIAEVPIDKL